MSRWWMVRHRRRAMYDHYINMTIQERKAFCFDCHWLLVLIDHAFKLIWSFLCSFHFMFVAWQMYAFGSRLRLLEDWVPRHEKTTLAQSTGHWMSRWCTFLEAVYSFWNIGLQDMKKQHWLNQQVIGWVGDVRFWNPFTGSGTWCCESDSSVSEADKGELEH